MTDWVLAADVGGTNLRAAAVDRAGRAARLRGVPVPRPASPANVLSALSCLLAAAGRETRGRVIAATLSLKGIVDKDRGLSRRIAGFEAWKDVPVAARLRRRLGIPVLLENDARCAAVGEGWLGRARGVRNYAFVIVGTGIGTGIVREGRLASGARGHAGELGHMVVAASDRSMRCSCGEFGHWEALAAGPSIAARARLLLRKKGAADLRRFARLRPGTVDGGFVAAAAAAGVSSARTVLAEAGRWLGVGLYNIARTEDPSLIVIGGGAAGAGDFLLKPAAAECSRSLAVFGVPCPPIEPSILGASAGILGAAARAWSPNLR